MDARGRNMLHNLLQRIFVLDPNQPIRFHELRVHPALWIDKRLLSSVLLPFAEKMGRFVCALGIVL
jgi:hypothetical protein